MLSNVILGISIQTEDRKRETKEDPLRDSYGIGLEMCTTSVCFSSVATRLIAKETRKYSLAVCPKEKRNRFGGLGEHPLSMYLSGL